MQQPNSIVSMSLWWIFKTCNKNGHCHSFTIACNKHAMNLQESRERCYTNIMMMMNDLSCMTLNRLRLIFSWPERVSHIKIKSASHLDYTADSQISRQPRWWAGRSLRDKVWTPPCHCCSNGPRSTHPRMPCQLGQALQSPGCSRNLNKHHDSCSGHSSEINSHSTKSHWDGHSNESQSLQIKHSSSVLSLPCPLPHPPPSPSVPSVFPYPVCFHIREA